MLFCAGEQEPLSINGDAAIFHALNQPTDCYGWMWIIEWAFGQPALMMPGSLYCTHTLLMSR